MCNRPESDKVDGQWKRLGSRPKEGDRPVHEVHQPLAQHPSTAGHVKPCWNLGGPPSKAKYYLMTDSEPVP